MENHDCNNEEKFKNSTCDQLLNILDKETKKRDS